LGASSPTDTEAPALAAAPVADTGAPDTGAAPGGPESTAAGEDEGRGIDGT
jgi:hypothetical protein